MKSSCLLPGPSPEWMVQHTLTPGDLRDLQVELVKTSVATEFSILMNISWILRADASIRFLKATKILFKSLCPETWLWFSPHKGSSFP